MAIRSGIHLATRWSTTCGSTRRSSTRTSAPGVASPRSHQRATAGSWSRPMPATRSIRQPWSPQPARSATRTCPPRTVGTPLPGASCTWPPIAVRSRTSTSASWSSAQATQRCRSATTWPRWPRSRSRHVVRSPSFPKGSTEEISTTGWRGPASTTFLPNGSLDSSRTPSSPTPAVTEPLSNRDGPTDVRCSPRWTASTSSGPTARAKWWTPSCSPPATAPTSTTCVARSAQRQPSSAHGWYLHHPSRFGVPGHRVSTFLRVEHPPWRAPRRRVPRARHCRACTRRGRPRPVVTGPSSRADPCAPSPRAGGPVERNSHHAAVAVHRRAVERDTSPGRWVFWVCARSSRLQPSHRPGLEPTVVAFVLVVLVRVGLGDARGDQVLDHVRQGQAHDR